MTPTTELSEVRLMRPTTKMSARLVRQALIEVAQDEGVDYLTLEETYTNTRSALVHLLAHDRYRTEIEDRMAELVQKTEVLLACPGVERLSRKKNWMQDLAEAATDLDQYRQRLLKAWVVKPEAVAQFLKVVEVAHEKHRLEQCDSSHIITSQLYALAHLMHGNFEAYDKTLNT